MNLFSLATRGIDLDALPYEDEPSPRKPIAFDEPAGSTGRFSVPSDLNAAFEAAASEFGVDPDVLRAVAHTESRFNPDIISGKVKSSAGAIGLMQFMPNTAKEYGIDPTDPIQAIFGGAAYLRKSLDKFDGDYGKAVASYNAGPNRKDFDAEDWDKRMPAETQDYLRKVFTAADSLKHGNTGSTPAIETKASALPAGVTASTAGGGRGSVSPGDINTKLTRIAVPDMTAGSVAQDVLSGALQIGPTAVKGVGELIRLATGDRLGKGVTDFAERGIKVTQDVVGSDRAAAQRQNLSADMADDSVGLGKAIVDNKGALADQILPTIGSMILPVGVAGVAGKAATVGKVAQGLDTAALAARVASVQQAAGIGATAAQNAASTFAELVDKGVSMQDAYKAAGITVPFSILAGKLTGGGVEGALIKAATSKEAVKRGVGEVGKGVIKEGAQEGGESLGQVTGEVLGANQDVSLESAIKRVGTEALLGAVVGGGFNAAQQMAPTVESQPTTPQAPTATPDSRQIPEKTPTTQAAQAVDQIQAILEAERNADTTAATVQPGSQAADIGTAPVAQGPEGAQGGLGSTGETVVAGQPESAQSLSQIRQKQEQVRAAMQGAVSPLPTDIDTVRLKQEFARIHANAKGGFDPLSDVNLQTGANTTGDDVKRLVTQARQEVDAKETAEIQRMLAEDAAAKQEMVDSARATADGVRSDSDRETQQSAAEGLAQRARTRLVDNLVASYAEPTGYFASPLLKAVASQLDVLQQPALTKQEQSRIADLATRAQAFIAPSLPTDKAAALPDTGADNASMESLIKEKQSKPTVLAAEMAALKARNAPKAASGTDTEIKRSVNGESASEEDYLTTLFGADAATPGAAPASNATGEVDLNQLVPQLRELSQKKLNEANDWNSREYKENRAQINLRGDGPTRQESISVSQANESRRRRNVEALTQQAQDASNLANRIERGRDVNREIATAISNAQEGKGPAIGKTLQDKIEGYISNALLGDENYSYGDGSLARLIRETYEAGAQTSQSVEAVTPQDSAQEATKAEDYEAETGFAPYVPEGSVDIDVGVGTSPEIKRSVKAPYEPGKVTTRKKEVIDPVTGEKKTVVVSSAERRNDLVTGLPLNQDGTVTLYFPTTNANARKLALTKKLVAAPGASRIYLTNESSGGKVMSEPGSIENEMDGANVLVTVDPSLLHFDTDFESGRKDFFIPVTEGQAFKSKMTRLFTQYAPRTKAITKDTKLTDLEARIASSVAEYQDMTPAQRRVRLREAKDLLKEQHNVGTLLSVNGKLEKTNTGGYGLNDYDGQDVKSLGLGLASAQKINEQNLSTCPKSAICEGLCLGETSGQNQLYGGEGDFKSGPRMSQYLKTEAMVMHPEEFAIVLFNEISQLSKKAAKEDYKASVRLNVTSDFRPQTFKGIINAFPEVMFYDYTKLPTKSLGDNHHLTYSSTGATQVVNGQTISNKESNWNKMVEVMRRGDNVAMAFSDRNEMPAYVVDGVTGERFQVWNGDNYDARFLDPKPGESGNEFGKGMIIGLTNKDRTTAPQNAAREYNGFFINYNPEVDGDTVVIPDQSAPKAQPINFVPRKKSEAAAKPAAPSTPISTITQAITKAYGNALTRLQGKGLVTLTQTEDEALKAAAAERAKVNGTSEAVELQSLRASVNASQRAWHGTPHRGIEKFSTDKIGTGEGAQAYGWGLYFASSKQIAEHYRNKLALGKSEFDLVYKGSEEVLSEDVPGAALVKDRVSSYGADLRSSDIKRFKEIWAEDIERLTSRGVEWNDMRNKYAGDERMLAIVEDSAASDEKRVQEIRAAIALIDNVTRKAKGQLYEVDIPNDSDMLLWDKPLSQQTAKAREAIIEIAMRADPESSYAIDQINRGVDPLVSAFYKTVANYMPGADYSGSYPGAKQLSLALNELGIKGIKYLGDGSYNYVVFDGADVQIVDVKYSKDGHLQGFHDPATGKSFLISDNLTAETAPAVFMHEVGVHMAADGKLQPMFDRAVNLLKMARDNAFIKRVQERMDTAGETSGEEAAAYIVEEYERDRTNAPASVSKWIKDFIADVRAWLFKQGVLLKADQLTVADIAAVARANVRGMANEGGWTGYANIKDAFRFGNTDGQRSKSIAEVADAFSSDRIKLVGVDMDDGSHQVYLDGAPDQNMTVYPVASGRWRINAQDANRGIERSGDNAGQRMYQALFAWAHNNGHTVDAEFALSFPNELRRTSAMLSSALRFNTTDHLGEVDETQWVDGWKDGDFASDVKALADAELRKVGERILALGDFTINKDTGAVSVRTDSTVADSLFAGSQVQSANSGLGESATRGIRGEDVRNGAGRKDGQVGARPDDRNLQVNESEQTGIARGMGDGATVSQTPVSDSELARYLASTRGGFESHGVGVSTLKRALITRDHNGASVPGLLYSVAAPGQQPAPQPKRSAWKDEQNRVQFAPGSWLFDKLGKVADPVLSWAGMKAASPELKKQLRTMKLGVQKAQETSAKIAAETAKLSQDEREMVSDLIEKTLKAGVVPPAHAVKLAALINQTMSAQTDELIDLGMLSKDAAERWRGEYLPRFYASKLRKGNDSWADALKNITKRVRMMQGIKGKHLKSRGLFETVDAGQIADYEALGWELRDDGYEPGTSTTAQMWRDFTPEERENMGEIKDAGFRFVMGYMQTQKDIALGRMFKSIAETDTLSSRLQTDKFTVQVPDTKVEGAGAYVYGALAGRYVSKDVLDHLSGFGEAHNDVLQVYRKAMSLWKEGKTVLNPVSHVNNTISNITMAHLAGVGYHRVDKYAAAARDFATNSKLIEQAKDAGLFLGSFNQAELFDAMPPELKELAKMEEGKGTKVVNGLMQALTFGLRNHMGKAYEFEDSFFKYVIFRDSVKRGMSPEDAVDYAQKFIFTYDDLPKTARRIRDFGIPFFAYTYKAVPALLETTLKHPERMALPASMIWAATTLAYAVAAGGDDEPLDELVKKYATDQSFRDKVGEAKKFDQAHLPKWMRGYTSLAVPKAIRVGTDAALDMPVFMDISRLIPGGDLFDVTPNAGGLPLPQPITPNHPILTMAMGMLGNKDMFTGKDLVKKSDSDSEAAEARLKWIYKQVAPAIAFGNYHSDRALDMIAGASDGKIEWLPEFIEERYTGVGRDEMKVQPKYAIPQTFGIKLRPIDQDKAEDFDRADINKLIHEIDADMRGIHRQNNAGIMSDTLANKRLAHNQLKKDRLREGLTVDGDTKD